MPIKTAFSMLSLLVCGFSVHAQVSATLSHLPDGSTEFKIKNNAAVDLVAYEMIANAADGKHAPFVASSDLTGQLRPNQEISFTSAIPCGQGRNLNDSLRPILPPPPSRTQLESKLPPDAFCQFEQPVFAGIMADGSTTGDPSVLVRLLLWRSNMLLAVETTLDILSDAGRRNVPRGQLIEQFKKIADSLNRWYVLPEQRAGHDIYQSMAAKLINLPEVPPGSPFPPNSFVAQETATLRQQRAALEPSLAGVSLNKLR